mgnify:CR=1 FL=1
MRTTIKDVARQANVSTATVSHVFNNTRYVSEEVAERVRKAAAELGYIQNNLAKGLRSSESKKIGLLVPNISNYFSVDIISDINEVFRENGYQVILGYSYEDITIEKEQMELFFQEQVDGVIMFPAPGNHSYLSGDKRRVPIVLIDRKAEGLNADCVMANNEDAVFNTVCQLIEAGHREIGILKGKSGISNTEDRILGYKRALEKYGVLINSDLICMGESDSQLAYAETERLLKKGNVTALMVCSSSMELGVMKCLMDYGIKVPDEVAVVGLGNGDWTQVTNPPMTVLEHPTDEMSHLAAELLLDRIRNGGTDYKEYQLKMKLIRRKSF